MADPGSVEQWLQLVKRHEQAARLMQNSKLVAAEAYWHAGLAVECALKAYILNKERRNEWPSREAREDLYTHNLRYLLAISGLEIDRRSPHAPSWFVALQWQRHQGYDPKPMPRRVANS